MTLLSARQQVKFEHDPEKIVWTQAYQNPDHRNTVAWQMIVFGLEEFFRAHVIKNLKELDDMVRWSNARLVDERQMSTFIQPFVWEKLADDFRMTVFFENYMKAMLLFNGCMIHRMKLPDGNEQRRFDKFQKGIPVNVQTLAISNAVEKNIERITIGMGVLLSEPYQKVIRLPELVLKHVRQMNKTRNHLHLRTSVQFEVSKGIVDELKAVKEFAQEWLVKAKSAEVQARIMNPWGWKYADRD